jgi:AraC family L-rhamnose operon regulatory protein RhaS
VNNEMPRYRSATAVYEADSCTPLAEAVERDEIRLEALVRGQYPGRPLPRHGLPSVKTVGFWDAKHPQTWGLGTHRNEGIEITFLETGELDFTVHSDQYKLVANDLTIVRPWQDHSLGAPNVGAGLLHWLVLDVGVRHPNQRWQWPDWFILSADDIKELTRMLRRNEHPVWNAGVDIRRCFRQIANAVAKSQDGSSISRLAVRINELFVLLLDLLRSKKVPLDADLTSTKRTVRLFLEKVVTTPELLATPWTVKHLARGCGMGSTQFSFYCKQLTNVSPLEYLNSKRLERAKTLLEQGNLSIQEIAYQCGFASSQYFATAFRRRYRCAPSAFRKNG